MEGYIYLTTNKINGKKYIGKKTSNKFLGTRYLGSGRYLMNAIKSYGKENFRVEILEEVDKRELLTERELFWIDKLNAVEDEEFYNQIRESSPGRDGIPNSWNTRNLQSLRAKQRCKTEEGKLNLIKAAKAANLVEGRSDKISKTLKEKYKSGEMKPYWSGKTMEKEIREKMSKSRVGHSFSEKTKSKISQANKGRKAIHKDKVVKMIKPSELNFYLQTGWKLGKK